MRRALQAAAIWIVMAGAAKAGAEGLPFYPLVQGLYWVYAGQVHWGLGISGDKPAHGASITWKSEIIGVVRGSDFVAARFRGMPFDLSDYRPGLKPEDSIVAEVKGRGIFLASGDAVPWLWREIKRGGPSGAGYVRAQWQFVPLFPYPLAPTDPASVAAVRAMGGTAQSVGAPRPFDVKEVAGSPFKHGDQAEAYPIGFCAGSERTAFRFVPRLGIVSYDDRVGPVRASVRLVRIGWEKIGD